MKNEISLNYIREAIDKIEQSLGIKNIIKHDQLFTLMQANNIKQAIEMIAQQLGLPVSINIVISDKFETMQLANKYEVGGESISAQVLIPSNLPFYGSPALKNYPITVKISNNCRKYPATFSMILSHELTHVLLYSLNSPEKNNEIYTDLTAMMLGFVYIYEVGRKATTTEEFLMYKYTETSTYGYLSDEQFTFTVNEIGSRVQRMREERAKLIGEIKSFKDLFKKYQKDLQLFNKSLDYIFKNHNKQFLSADAKKITTFFQPGYVDKIKLEQLGLEQKINRIEIHCNDRSTNLSTIRKYISETEEIILIVRETFCQLNDNISVLRKYMPFSYKIRMR